MTASAPRTRWKGWTLVDEGGNFVSGTVTGKPLIWRLKRDAKAYESGGQRVMPCEVRVIK